MKLLCAKECDVVSTAAWHSLHASGIDNVLEFAAYRNTWIGLLETRYFTLRQVFTSYHSVKLRGFNKETVSTFVTLVS
jgi:hypothetical protein